MKNIFLVLLSVLIGGACSNHEEVFPIVDVYPYRVNLDVCDAAGQTLLDTTIEGNRKFLENTFLTYKKETFAVSHDRLSPRTPLYAPSTRAYYAPFEGMQVISYTNGNRHLCIGPFLGDEERERDMLVIQWGDGSKDTLTLTNHFTGSDKNNLPMYNRHAFWNAQEFSLGNILKVVKNPAK